MIESIFNYLIDLLYGNFSLAVFSSFIWGILSIILSPCHLSSIPLIIGFLSSQGEISTKKTFYLSLVFSVGILITIAAIGAITFAMGRLMGDIGVMGNYIVAFIFLIVGLYLLDWIKLPWDGANMSSTKYKGYMAAFVLGLIFGVGLGPCAFAFMAPVMGVVFQISSTNTLLAISLIVAFSLGHCFVIVLAGTLTKVVQQYLNWTEGSKVSLWFKKICGILIIIGAVYMVWLTF